MSATDIAAGADWQNEIRTGIEPATFGVVCLTRENLSRPWLLFEAGAIGMKFGRTRVCPYLLGVRPADVQPPLSMFQSVEATKEGTIALVKSINEHLGERRLEENALKKTVDVWWPTLAEDLGKIPDAPAQAQPRSDREILEEILALARSAQRDEGDRGNRATERIRRILEEQERVAAAEREAALRARDEYVARERAREREEYVARERERERVEHEEREREEREREREPDGD